MIVTKKEAWSKIQKLNISIFKKEIIFYNIFEYELKEFMETEKNTKNVKTLVSQLVYHAITLDDVKKTLIDKKSISIKLGLIKVGRIDDNYILYLDLIK